MFSLKNKRDQRGFTIIELLIVIVVIGILALLVITTYSGIQAKARDTKRQTDLQALQSKVEEFYATNNYYPALADINSDTFRSASMKGLSVETLSDPSNKTATPNQLSGTPASATNKNVYGYVAKNSSNATCTAGDTTCSSFSLTAYQESPGTVLTKTSSN